MAEPLTIRRINSIRNLGPFQKCSSSAANPEFHKFNLLYGFNGTGKTTLSRILASLEVGLLRPELPLEGEFQVELSNGNTIKNDANLSALKGRLLVFNTDFIESNFRWKDGRANPIFYLGTEQTKLSQRLESIENDLNKISPKLENANRAVVTADRTFANYKRETARQIGEQINQARSYDASNIAADYTRLDHDDDSILEEEARRQLRQLINADAPPTKLEKAEYPAHELLTCAQQTRDLLSTTLGELAISELSKHESMLVWIREGVKYHEVNKLDCCLFCGSPLENIRLSKLKTALNENFNKLFDDIQTKRELLTKFHAQLDKLESQTPSRNDVAKECLKAFSVNADQLNRLVKQGRSYVNAMLAALETKATQPNLSVVPAEIPAEMQAKNWDQEISHAINDLNSIIDQHNASHDSFSQSQATAKSKLKLHFLAEGQARFNELDQVANDAKAELTRLQGQADELTKQSAELRQSLRKHGPAAAKINELIACYLGHKALQIEAVKEGEEGYIIKRDGDPLSGPLSEGEKTAIAICYFLSMIEAEGRQLKDLIIVVDDPISSLDTRALNYAFNLIRGALTGAAQLFILTHNLFFMNEVKKWLKNRHEKGDAALLFLDTQVEQTTGRRTTNIVEMPKLIREYESEYHYLFYLTLGFKNSPQSYNGYFYLMPNALRKMLDIFFAFKVPGSSGLPSKLDNAIVRDCGIDRDKIRALDRLAQLESHADSLDDLVSLSSISLEETRDATVALFTLIEAVDPSHYKQMCSLCS